MREPKIRLGGWREHAPMTMDVTIELRPPQHREVGLTIEHEPIDEDALELSIIGHVYERGRDVGGGQNTDDVLKVEPNDQWGYLDLLLLHAVWDRWHLNGMRAGCAHHPYLVHQWDENGRGRVDLDKTPACPITGYKYGHSWLFEPIPPEVIDQVRKWQELAS